MTVDSLPAKPPDTSVILQDTTVVPPVASQQEPVRSNSHRTFFALADQGIVSGTSFCATILVMRSGSEAELGAYWPAFTVLLLVICVQQSLVCLPFTVYSPRLKGEEKKRLAGSVLVHSLGISAICASLIAFGAFALWLSPSSAKLASVMATVACTTPFILLREFARRYKFARLASLNAFLFDAVVCSIQLVGLFVLSQSESLTAVNAHAWLGMACAIGSIGWLVRRRNEFRFDIEHTMRTLRQHVRFGSWALLAALISIASAYLVPWYLLITVGKVATGTLAACMTLADLSNPLVLGLSNLVAPGAAHAFAKGGRAELRRYIVRMITLLGLLMIFFAGVLIFWGADIATRLYHSDYSSRSQIISVLAIGAVMFALGMPTSEGLSAMERPRLNLVASLVAFACSFTVAVCFLGLGGLVAAAAAVSAGHFGSTAVRTFAFLWITRAREVPS